MTTLSDEGQAAPLRAPEARDATRTAEKIAVTAEPFGERDKGVFEVTVQIDGKEPGKSLLRTSPREFAFQAPAVK